MAHWYQSEESDLVFWVMDLDTHSTSVHHRRLCVWQGDFDDQWHWELELFSGIGHGPTGVADNRLAAMAAAEASLRGDASLNAVP